MSQQTRRRDEEEFFAVPGMLMPEPTQFIRTALSLLMLVLGWISVTLEVFIRHSFGIRYLSIVRVFLAWQILGLASLAAFMVIQSDPNATEVDSISLGGLTIVFLLVAVLQLLWTRIRVWRRVPWHTQSFGLSWLHPLIWRWDWLFFRLVEPVVCFGVGALISQNEENAIIGWWICLASVALLVKNNIAFNLQRERIWDDQDAEIEAHYLREARSGVNKAKAAGISVVSVPVRVAEAAKPMDTVHTVSEAMRQAELIQSQSGD